MRGSRVLPTAVLCCLAAECALAARAQVRDQFYAVFIGGKKAGWARVTRKAERNRVGSYFEFAVNVPSGKYSHRSYELETDFETPDGKPLEFSHAVGSSSTSGRITPGGKLRVDGISGSSAWNEELVWPAGAVLREAVTQRLLRGGLKEGAELSVKIYFPGDLKARDCTLRVGPTQEVDLLGQSASLTEVTESYAGEKGIVRQVRYVDRQMWPLKMKLQKFGVDLELVACDRVYAESEGEWKEFIGKHLLASPLPLGEAASAKSITYHLEMVSVGRGRRAKMLEETSPITIPETSSQSVRRSERGASWIVTVRPVAPPAGESFPHKGKSAAARLALRPDNSLQSDDPKVVALARRAVAGKPDAAGAAKAIEAFVHEYVRPSEGLGIQFDPAAKIVETKSGDCTECAVLAGALCRAVGIPARVVCGVAYAEEFDGRRNVFVPHMWTEAFIGENWIGLDASRGTCDGRRIVLELNAGSKKFSTMFETLERLKIEKIDVEK